MILKDIDDMTHSADDAEYFRLKEIYFENEKPSWRGEMLNVKLLVEPIPKP